MKINFKVCEEVKFEHEATIEVPEGIDIDEMLEISEKCDQFSDVLYTLEKDYRCKILEVCRDTDGSESEIEIVNYDEV